MFGDTVATYLPGSASWFGKDNGSFQTAGTDLRQKARLLRVASINTNRLGPGAGKLIPKFKGIVVLLTFKIACPALEHFGFGPTTPFRKTRSVLLTNQNS